MKLNIKALIITTCLTIAFILLIPITWTDLQEFQLWQSVDIQIMVTYPYLSLFKTIHLFIAVIIFMISCYHCVRVVDINKEAHSQRNSPDFLLTEGYYGKVRNPMYTFFLFIFVALAFALTSSLAIIIPLFVLLVVCLLILVEERVMLIPKFGETYFEYRKQVSHRLLRLHHIILLAILLSINIIGIFF